MNKISIKIKNINDYKAKFFMFRDNYKIIETQAFVGKNGITNNKKEGDGKTPIGSFKIGIAFGIQDKIEANIKYIKLNNNLYWIDDINSKFYNQIVDIKKVKKDWNSAEHLIEYPLQYEYAVEIKTNPKNIPQKGSAIFLHCSTGIPTNGCIAIDKENMIKVLKNLSENDLINIEKI